MEQRKRRNWMLVMMLVIAVTFSNVCPVIAAELPDQMALEKLRESEKSLSKEDQREGEVNGAGIYDEDSIEKGTEVSTPSNAQKPEVEDEEISDDFEEVFEDEELEDEGIPGGFEEIFEDEALEEEGIPDDLEEEPGDIAEDKALEEEKPKDLVWVWSDGELVLMEAEEWDDLSAQFFEIARASGACPTYEEAYNAMIGMKDEYHEGMPWTNFQPYGSEGSSPYYRFRGGKVNGASLGVGCAAFVFELSDAAFGDIPARTINNGGFKYEDVKVGDILRVNNSHFVIILEVNPFGVTVAEGNYNKSVHWGRVLSKAEVMNANFIVTRYPAGYSEDLDVDEVVQNGTEGSLSWTLTKGGTLTISGNGAMPDHTSTDSPTWEPFAASINQVIIKDGVTSIGSYAFYNKSSIMSVQIPETVTSIGTAAFKNSGLMSVTVPGSVKGVGDEAFYACQNLKSATFHEGVERIGVSAFQTCGIAYLDFPSTINFVGDGAFRQCQELLRVRFAKGDQQVSLGQELFASCWKLSYVTLPLKADKISLGMFGSCKSLPYLYIPTGIEFEFIGAGPFRGCTMLRTIDFGGTEDEWRNNNGPKALNNSGLDVDEETKVTVNYNVPFDDPFADIDGDPGEFVTCNHVDNDGNGRCDICDSVMSTDPTDPSEPVKPEEPSNPDNSQNPGDTGNSGNTSGGNSSGGSGSNSSGSSGGSGSSSGSSSGDSSSGDGAYKSSSGKSPNSTSGSSDKPVSTNITTNAAGEKVETARWSDGTVVVTTTDAAGAMKLEVDLAKQTAETAQLGEKAAALHIAPIQVTNDIAKAALITVKTGKKPRDIVNPDAAVTKPVKVLVPVTASGAGTVAVLVKADGSTQIIEDSTLIEGGMVVPVSDGDTVKLVDLSRAFADVAADAWYKEAVNYVTARNLFHGVTETTFNPAAPMTCATLVTALAQIEGLDTQGGATWYENGMSWAVTSGVIDAGIDPESTATSDLIKIYERYFDTTINDQLPAMLTRAEAAQMLLNLKRCRP